MPHKVPQNIDLEDKVIGPLTLKQFIYLMIGSGIIFIINFSLPPSLKFLVFPLALFIGSFFLALAFFKPGDRPFEVLLLSTMTTLTRPKKRVWKKLPYNPDLNKPVEKKAEEPKEKHYTSMDLRKLAFVVDAGGFEDELNNHGIKSAIKEDKKLEASTEIGDTLAATEEKNDAITALIAKAKEKVSQSKNEPSIQEMASVKPNQEFIYEKLKKSGGALTDYEETLANAKNTQEKRFEAAQLKH